MIRAGVGLSTQPNTIEAAREAVERALRALDGEPPNWCIVFCSDDHAASPEVLVRTLIEASGTPYVVGCSATGVLAEGREVERASAVGVLAVRSDSIRATPFLFRDEGDHGLTAGVRLGQRLMGSRGKNDLVLVWPDPFQVRPDRLLQGLDATLGGVPVAGGAASANSAGPRTFQFSGREMETGAVSGIRLGGAFSQRVVVSQGCRPLGAPVRVTRAHENLIFEVDGRPALDALKERAGEAIFEDPERALNALTVAFLPNPDDTSLRPGEFLVRNIVAADEDTGVLGIADTVEEGQLIVFALREPDAARADLARVLGVVASERPASEYRFGLYFNCLARGRSLYGREGVDAELLGRMLPGIPILGFFCNAEIAPMRGVNALFTYTGVLVLVSDAPAE